jgi:hypothetical protein
MPAAQSGIMALGVWYLSILVLHDCRNLAMINIVAVMQPRAVEVHGIFRTPQNAAFSVSVELRHTARAI